MARVLVNMCNGSEDVINQLLVTLLTSMPAGYVLYVSPLGSALSYDNITSYNKSSA